ncbi:methyl-accepting chemotaxis protein [Herbaspirillum sp.]|jgi:methyl-accepting chemotaxis protein|uniref:methyl-accepting chemotaxis protein n=1 Tax=Herbaspirillum TaxID=963 RepID=UPI0025831A30|nr:methyl-accepting chemotaxis protein [Herbaspirillum sp.]MCP3658671.1 chemotaxis protein [Herbaspirillum sp.]MCP3948891.1 chemotaxis protein [Herbaspirillum sp.]MCP4030162.1 chemotaxis protein [Herbaspirillum sp.]MCP4555466.1 chemotaxis protein [Herbaspirillum sp.]
MDFTRLTVSSRLKFGFGGVLVLMLLIVGISLKKLDEVNQQLLSITEVNNVEILHLSTMRAAAYEQSLASRGIGLATTPEDLKLNADNLQRQLTVYAQAEAALAKLFAELEETTETEKKSIVLIQKMSKEILPVVSGLVELAKAQRTEEIKPILDGPLGKMQAERRKALAELSAFEDKLNDDAKNEALAVYAAARRLLIALGVLALASGIVAAVLITRSVLRQLGGEPAVASTLAARIAQGDLRSEVDADSRLPNSLMMSMKSMNAGLREIVREVRSGTDAIATASSQIAAGNLDLSSRTEEQASSLEETASAMEQLTATVQQNADSAGEANRLATAASVVAGESGQLVKDVVMTMAAIEDSSKKIVDIISVIDGISFQTNILALNAAVEAARAGEQGRGFAVVASEVRSLAQRSSSAAKEIKTLIDDSVDKVASGSALVNRAGESMSNVVSSVDRVVSVIGAISDSSAEQSKGIHEINHAISQMDQVTQQNAALVEQAAAASQALQAQARRLSGVVEVFAIA